ncbi:MAG: LysM peptidoglycan-binding domain-containing protein [Lachnospiraceae bacterium]|nr:LysM peptidoglycan-binding domain-containing protein [Lachnospiraceae bacterium]
MKKRHRRYNKKMLRNLLILSLFLAALSVWGFGMRRAAAQPEKTEIAYTTVVVRAGDTLWSIAETYAPEYTSTAEFTETLRTLNHITRSDLLRCGQRLVIPYTP